MNEPKLYKHIENDETVVAFVSSMYPQNGKHWKVIKFNPSTMTTTLTDKQFIEEYKPLPEPPEVGSTAWAVHQALEGKTVKTGFITSKGLDYIELKKENDYGLLSGKDQRGNRYTLQLVLDRPNSDTKRTCDRITFVPNYQWEIVEEPEPIVEKLPHEMLDHEYLLAKCRQSDAWEKIIGVELAPFAPIYFAKIEGQPKKQYKYCIPYAGNEHLEGKITDGEHGAVPKHIIEKLPHEFVQGQEVLVREHTNREWEKQIYSFFGMSVYNYNRHHVKNKIEGSVRYCLPYAGNENLEGTVTYGEHGAVPKGYVPPHIPKLGDDDYWQVGDEVIDLFLGISTRITGVSLVNNRVETSSLNPPYTLDGRLVFKGNTAKHDIFSQLKSSSVRTLYHGGSYVRDDGTVHEHIPTRPYKITSQK